MVTKTAASRPPVAPPVTPSVPNPVTYPAQPVQRPAQPAVPQRSYDAKGHASDGSQSVGDDNPWKIGASAGMTYDPQTMMRWAAKADAGDPAAVQLLKNVGFEPGMTPQQWAQSRQLDVYKGDERSAYSHDPGYDSGGGFQPQAGYGNQANAKASYGWWEDGTPPQTGGVAPGGARRLGLGQDPTYSPTGDPNKITGGVAAFDGPRPDPKVGGTPGVPSPNMADFVVQMPDWGQPHDAWMNQAPPAPDKMFNPGNTYNGSQDQMANPADPRGGGMPDPVKSEPEWMKSWKGSW